MEKQWATILLTFLVRIKCKNVSRRCSSRFFYSSPQPLSPDTTVVNARQHPVLFRTLLLFVCSQAAGMRAVFCAYAGSVAGGHIAGEAQQPGGKLLKKRWTAMCNAVRRPCIRPETSAQKPAFLLWIAERYMGNSGAVIVRLFIGRACWIEENFGKCPVNDKLFWFCTDSGTRNYRAGKKNRTIVCYTNGIEQCKLLFLLRFPAV